MNALEKREMFEFIQSLLNWRKDANVIHHGRLKQFVPQDGMYVYFRYDDRDAVMVIVNKNKEEKSLPLSRFNEVLKDYNYGRDVVSGELFRLAEDLMIPPETAFILELE